MDVADPRWKTIAITESAEKAFPKFAHKWLGDAAPINFGAGNTYTDPMNWAGIALFRKALEGGEPVRNVAKEGNLKVPVASFLEMITVGLGVRLVFENPGDNGNGARVYSSEDTMIRVNIRESGQTAIVDLITISTEALAKASQIMDRVVVQDNARSGLIFALAKSSLGGFSIRRLGAAGTDLERGNYNPKVLADFDHVVKDLGSESPCGRLVIFAGEPGTGKTYLVRALLSLVPEAAFVVVPSHMVKELGSPEILPALSDAKSEFSGPIVLIVEDADQVLVNRKEGDMSSISAMLNLGDGILGAVLDIRIVATTNAEQLDMDPATRRRGRLCRYIDVNPLEPAVATAALHRLVPGSTTVITQSEPLANVYHEAREEGWVAPPIASRRPEMAKHLM